MLQDKIERAIKLLQDNEPKDDKGYGLAFSGGKDSIVIKQLAIESGVKFKAFYSQTTIDPPDLIKYIKKYHNDILWLHNTKGGFFKRLIENGMFPAPMFRWCCNEFKERAIQGYKSRIIGVRASESIRRAKRWKEKVEDFTGVCDYIICPIVDWTDEDVWNFIIDRKLPYCELYDKGFKRLGCIGCPMATKKELERQFEMYPQIKNAWIKASQLMWERHKDRLIKQGKNKGKPHRASFYVNGEDWFNDYINKRTLNDRLNEQCQMELMFTGIEQE